MDRDLLARRVHDLQKKAGWCYAMVSPRIDTVAVTPLQILYPPERATSARPVQTTTFDDASGEGGKTSA
ncbi:hypothetical protein GGTG_07550 [Gaeumannomyces tritici R3-111a-1]|uniref:Uncharacterized protein n=1 Tax=Gaeumannomyces tritici (strain R3-111a-1) TaxID=644352 RepID=J3P202_GAET3|nr:hypothetical protein GGTG_07550 [Gaeumannomyces tritici R3-111a-1]EJT73694.1 hypothetical protein GGTG_07550 [Gaeumannomyces tritici R3-111a-1]